MRVNHLKTSRLELNLPICYIQTPTLVFSSVGFPSLLHLYTIQLFSCQGNISSQHAAHLDSQLSYCFSTVAIYPKIVSCSSHDPPHWPLTSCQTTPVHDHACFSHTELSTSQYVNLSTTGQRNETKSWNLKETLQKQKQGLL